MEFREFERNAGRTVRSDLSRTEALTDGVFGLVGETGEVVDLVKKHLFQGHVLNRDKLVEELGDCLWYLSLIARSCGTNLTQAAQNNIAKLQGRYPEGFSAERSINR